MSPPSFLFAYGTLRPGFAPREIRPTVERLTFVGHGTTGGTLYHLGAYPAAAFGLTGTIKGVVYALPTDAAEILGALDTYEGVPDLYERRVVPVSCDGQTHDCWAYAYRGNVAGCPPIPSGVYAQESRP